MGRDDRGSPASEEDNPVSGFYDSVELPLFFHPVVMKLGGEAVHHGALRYRQ